MNLFRRFFQKINQESLTKSQKKQRFLLLVFAEIIIVAFMIYITLSDIILGNDDYIVFSSVLLISYTIALTLTLLEKGRGFSNIFFCCAIALNFLYSFYIRGNNGIGSIWLLLLPVLSMYVVGLSYGFYSTVFAAAGLVTLYVVPVTRHHLASLYEIDFLVRYTILFVVDSALSTVSMMNFHSLRISENESHQELIEAVNDEHNKVVSISTQTILAISNAVEAKNVNVGKHSVRVAHFSCLLAEELGWSEAEIKHLHTIAMLHDIGKIGISSSILNKDTTLTAEEFEEMKQHTIIGGNILKDLTIIPGANLVANYHHEHFDGNGYPESLLGEEIPIEARIVSIADAFDAMKYPRGYKKTLDIESIRNEFLKCKGTQFDPNLTDIFLKVCEENNWFENYEVQNVG